MEQRTRGMLEMVAAMVISGTIGWLVVVSGRPVTEVVFWRCALGAVVLLPVCAALGYLRPGTIKARQVWLAVAGGAAIVANWLLLFSAYEGASIAIATAVYNTQPFMLVGLGAVFLGERITARKLGWLLAAFCGVLLIVRAGPEAGSIDRQYLLGVVLALGAAFFYAVAALIAKKLKDTPPHLIALIHVLVGTVMLMPLALSAPWPTGLVSWGTLATLGVVHTGLMYILLYGAIQKLPTHMTGALSFIYPVVAIVVDRLAFGHQLHPSQIVGAALILLAAAGMTLGWSWRSLMPGPRGESSV
ncbi:EamA domain-containing membrane protein RarD [Cupriavidus gilardii J11]|uniref:EamA domain-containing membrane protein RarD n=1 Tax=Cupriavidus gilardii J11 TaxID=936133 RepID=A0A562BTW4_9BURK|nr:DMT family transporter [Cupriavidus gilardii]TWG88681.1 EamA domain-containing membrane protein RarD [Cupriavidus gilardii J11]